MWGEAWAELGVKVFSYLTDAEGLARLQKRLAITRLKREILDAIHNKDFVLAAAKLHELERVSDAA